MRWHRRPGIFGIALTMGAAAALPVFFGTGVRRGAYFFEVTLSADGRGFAQVYYDFGKDFREQDSTRQDLKGGSDPAVYRLALPPGLYRNLRFDPIDHEGAASFSGARIVDSEGRTLRRFAPGDFRPAHDIASLGQRDGVLEMRTTAGGKDPYLMVDIGAPFYLGFGFWDRLLASLPAFLAVSAGAFAFGSLLPDGAISCLSAGSDRWMFAGGLLLVAFKIWLTSAQTIYAVGATGHDDRLFLEQAGSLLAGRWLGPYSQFTLMKGPMYPLFIALTFLLGVPLFVAQNLLYAVACWLLVRAIRPLAPSRVVRAALFTALLFNPITFDGIRMMRVARQNLIPALVLLIVAGLVALYARRDLPKRKLLPWAVLTGLALPAFWLTREEGAWLLPCMGFLWLGAAAGVWRGRMPDRIARLALLAAPAALWAAGLCIVAAINLHYYGLFTTCEFWRTEFKSAYGALMRVEPAAWRPGIVVPRETRERIYAVSPAFAELRPSLEGANGEGWALASQGMTGLPAADHEFAGGWFMWALRDAVVAAGRAHNGAEAMAFYARLAREVNQACDSGALKSGPPRTGLMPPLRREYARPVWTAFQGGWGLVLHFRGLFVDSPPSEGTARSLALFSDLTRGRLSPPVGWAHILPKQQWLDRVRLGMLEGIGALYVWAAPKAVGAALLALVCAIVVGIARRRPPYFALASLGLLASMCAMVAICAILDTTSFPAVDVAYLTGCHGLVLLLVFFAWLGLAEALRRDAR